MSLLIQNGAFRALSANGTSLVKEIAQIGCRFRASLDRATCVKEICELDEWRGGASILGRRAEEVACFVPES
jgi:hypothetical protein